jgi:hypothetical protein
MVIISDYDRNDNYSYTELDILKVADEIINSSYPIYFSAGSVWWAHHESTSGMVERSHCKYIKISEKLFLKEEYYTSYWIDSFN